MDLSFNAEERAFEKEVRDFIAANLTPEMKRATALTPSVFSDPDIGMAWQRALHQKGWGAPGWPVEHGGPDWTPAQRWIFEAESARAGAPNVNVMGVKMVGPVIIGFGSPEQKNFYLPRILAGEGLLVPGLFRAGLGLGSRLAEDTRGARWRRLHHQRHQDMDHACASRQPHVRTGADQ
jgi:acyl-CoA dehydrogenase